MFNHLRRVKKPIVCSQHMEYNNQRVECESWRKKMKSSNEQIDASMKAYAKKWMKTFNRPRASTTLGYFFVGLFILLWSSSLTRMLGYNLSRISGSLIFILIGSGLTIVAWSVIHIMAKIGIERPVRSAILLSAVIGPYVNMATYNSWNSGVVSHIAGFIASIFAFLASFLLDKILMQKPNNGG